MTTRKKKGREKWLLSCSDTFPYEIMPLTLFFGWSWDGMDRLWAKTDCRLHLLWGGVILCWLAFFWLIGVETIPIFCSALTCVAKDEEALYFGPTYFLDVPHPWDLFVSVHKGVTKCRLGKTAGRWPFCKSLKTMYNETCCQISK